MVRPQLYILIFYRYTPRDVQLATANIEVGRGDGDGKVDFHALADRGPAVRGFSYTAEGAGAKKVGGLDQVIGVPLEMELKYRHEMPGTS